VPVNHTNKTHSHQRITNSDLKFKQLYTSKPTTRTPVVVIENARVRLEGALARFDQECRRRAASGQHVVSTGFGTVSVEDYARFTEMHTRHHCKQMPGAT
jgi:hypothetical protein